MNGFACLKLKHTPKVCCIHKTTGDKRPKQKYISYRIRGKGNRGSSRCDPMRDGIERRQQEDSGFRTIYRLYREEK